MSLDASAKNMQAVCKAKEHHDKTCPWGGTGNAVHLNWFDIERMGWDEGDVICGLVVVGDAKVATGMMRVTCDAEPAAAGAPRRREVELVEAVAADRELSARRSLVELSASRRRARSAAAPRSAGERRRGHDHVLEEEERPDPHVEARGGGRGRRVRARAREPQHRERAEVADRRHHGVALPGRSNGPSTAMPR